MPPAPGRAQWMLLHSVEAQALCLPGPHVPQPLLPLGCLQGNGGWAAALCSLTLNSVALPAWHSLRPPHRSGVQLAQGPVSVSSFIEMLPQLCPSSRFQSPKHPPGPFAAPSLTLETGLGFSGPRDVSPSAGWLRRGEALQKKGEGLEAAMEGPRQAHPEEGQGLLGSLIWGPPSSRLGKGARPG